VTPSELPVEMQQQVQRLEKLLISGTYFDLLGLKPSASSDEVRTAFHALSKTLHPDRYFGKNLGEYKARLDVVFKKVIEANGVLSDAQKKDQYLKANPHLASRPKSDAKTPDDLIRDRERQQRLSKHPYLAKMTRINELLSAAKAEVAKEEYSLAFTHLNQASQIDSQHAEVKSMLVAVRQKNESAKSEASYKAGLAALEKLETAAALNCFKMAVQANPLHADAAHKVAELLERSRADAKEITVWAQKAVDAAPKNAEFRLSLGRAMAASGMKALAKRHFDEAVKLDPNNPEVKKQVKRLWPF
jgi:Flp pilus assembly protein TadD